MKTGVLTKPQRTFYHKIREQESPWVRVEILARHSLENQKALGYTPAVRNPGIKSQKIKR